MTEPEKPTRGRCDHPYRVDNFPFAATIDVAGTAATPAEPSPCLPTATATWYLLAPPGPASLTVDLTGSTPYDAVVRLYRQRRPERSELEFLGCASLIWNGQLTLEARVGIDEAILAQVGTSESCDGTLVIRAELRAGVGTRSIEGRGVHVPR